MGRRRPYQATPLKSVDVGRLLETITSAVVVSIDVAKAAFVAAIQTAAEGVIRIVRFEHPADTRRFLELVVALRDKAGELIVLMEPTGTYGDAIRYQLHALNIEVRMIQPKRTHDAREVFDGVPSQHDPKAAITMAQLHSTGASSRWIAHSDERRSLRAQLDRYQMHAEQAEIQFNRIEARLARHWPEFEQWLSVRVNVSARALLAAYCSPQRVALDPSGARKLLERASRRMLSREVIDGLIDSARSTLGVPMVEDERVVFADLVATLERELTTCEEIDRQLEQASSGNIEVKRMIRAVGAAAAVAIGAYLGFPSAYAHADTILKAAGLNMRETSSGTEKGNVHITKRGPSVVRQLLYLAALRAIAHDPVARAWYAARKAVTEKHKTAAVVALMRKLLKGAYHVARCDEPFDTTKLFDTRRLTIAPKTTRKRAGPRRQPRSTARRGTRARATITGGATP